MPLAADYPFLDLVWTMSIFFVGLIWLWLLIKVFFDLIFRRHDMSALVKVCWLVFVMLVPFVGVFVYLIVKKDTRARRRADVGEVERTRRQEGNGRAYDQRMAEAARLLIVSGAEAASVEDLPSAVRELIDNASEVLVVAPVLTSRLHLWTNDTDRAREEADERFGGHRQPVAASGSEGHVEGVVGDDIPILAFDDAVRTFSPDHILIGLRSDMHASWQERGLVDEVKERFHLPVTIIEIDDNGRVSSRARLLALLALVVAAIGTLGAGCGGGGTATEASGTEQLSKAISRFTGLSPGEADAIAGSVRSTSDGALAALTQSRGRAAAAPEQRVRRDRARDDRPRQGLDGDAALADLCGAILDQPSLEPSIQLDPASDALEVRWPERSGCAARPCHPPRRGQDPGAEVQRRRLRGDVPRAVRGHARGGGASGVPEGSDPNEVLLWLRVEQLRSGACG